MFAKTRQLCASNLGYGGDRLVGEPPPRQQGWQYWERNTGETTGGGIRPGGGGHVPGSHQQVPVIQPSSRGHHLAQTRGDTCNAYEVGKQKTHINPNISEPAGLTSEVGVAGQLGGCQTLDRLGSTVGSGNHQNVVLHRQNSARHLTSTTLRSTWGQEAYHNQRAFQDHSNPLQVDPHPQGQAHSRVKHSGKEVYTISPSLTPWSTPGAVRATGSQPGVSPYGRSPGEGVDIRRGSGQDYNKYPLHLGTTSSRGCSTRYAITPPIISKPPVVSGNQKQQVNLKILSSASLFDAPTVTDTEKSKPCKGAPPGVTCPGGTTEYASSTLESGYCDGGESSDAWPPAPAAEASTSMAEWLESLRTPSPYENLSSLGRRSSEFRSSSPHQVHEHGYATDTSINRKASKNTRNPISANNINSKSSSDSRQAQADLAKILRNSRFTDRLEQRKVRREKSKSWNIDLGSESGGCKVEKPTPPLSRKAHAIPISHEKQDSGIGSLTRSDLKSARANLSSWSVNKAGIEEPKKHQNFTESANPNCVVDIFREGYDEEEFDDGFDSFNVSHDKLKGFEDDQGKLEQSLGTPWGSQRSFCMLSLESTYQRKQDTKLTEDELQKHKSWTEDQSHNRKFRLYGFEDNIGEDFTNSFHKRQSLTEGYGSDIPIPTLAAQKNILDNLGSQQLGKSFPGFRSHHIQPLQRYNSWTEDAFSTKIPDLKPFQFEGEKAGYTPGTKTESSTEPEDVYAEELRKKCSKSLAYNNRKSTAVPIPTNTQKHKSWSATEDENLYENLKPYHKSYIASAPRSVGSSTNPELLKYRCWTGSSPVMTDTEVKDQHQKGLNKRSKDTTDRSSSIEKPPQSPRHYQRYPSRGAPQDSQASEAENWQRKGPRSEETSHDTLGYRSWPSPASWHLEAQLEVYGPESETYESLPAEDTNTVMAGSGRPLVYDYCWVNLEEEQKRRQRPSSAHTKGRWHNNYINGCPTYSTTLRYHVAGMLEYHG